MILEIYLVTAALGLTSATINNAVLKRQMKKDGYKFSKASLGKKMTNFSPLVLFALTPIYNVFLTFSILAGGYDINKYMVNRLLQNCDKDDVLENDSLSMQKEEKPTEQPIITKLEDIKTPQDRISYVNYEYEKAKKENKPYTLVRKR